MAGLEAIITKKRNSLKTDRLDMSFGELMNMHEDGDLFITPEYQRVFRWSDFQQTRFIESVLLGIPIPPIFVAEDGNGRWEVVDGLQRISTIFSFFGLLEAMPEKNNSTMSQGEMVRELEGVTIDTLPLKLKTTIKRAVCRVEIVRWDSNEDIRYELFNRLNTGASPLSDQEIRNCIFRSYAVNLNEVLREIAKLSVYEELISPSVRKKDEMFLEELVLRYFAFKHLDGEFKTTVPQFLTEFMKSVSNGQTKFNLKEEKADFMRFVNFMSAQFGKEVFRPKGNFALHIFDSLAYAIPKSFGTISGNEKRIAKAIGKLKSDVKYNSIGTSTFSNSRIKSRMDRALEIFNAS
ncbi:hypothetical protein CU664_06145 [Pseudomonas syringae pv. actinidifoliorum]|uniref:DUF262 domain-containing protein n=1 Tax=Pseudomonas syringae TaxID=317 RepID=UPI00137368C8|nr:DUF262 domain-containing protein [Pseudomonas syringae]NAS95371.1 hypothetical protein [Pseudomonas syringae pv. actinidifoliorum]NAT62906.1 hypothetical protein [Pseudomonas syringae pv. actinidifoliorum]